MQKTLRFYNEFDQKLIRDYINGNPRIESAIINLSSFIPKNSKNILDIGCGIGWSSNEFSLKYPKALVDGIDLSPVLIDKASRLFQNDNLSFKVCDITKNLPSGTYDAAVLIDVYEHIPQSERKNFHYGLKKLLAEKGRIILSCPSKYHQNWLRKNNPEGLQPVDEDVDFKTMQILAKDLDSEIIFFEYQKIWRSYDYFYCVIENNPQYNSPDLFTKANIKLEEKLLREKRIKVNLGLDPGVFRKNTFKHNQKKTVLNRIFHYFKI